MHVEIAGVPDAVASGPWWGLFLFLLGVVFLRAQGTYWVGRGLRRGATGTAPVETSADATAPPEAAGTQASAESDGRAEPAKPSRRERLARRFSGPAWDRAQAFLERWGFLGIPVSFLTIGFQTMVNAAAGFMRMRWDLYTVAMIPGCIAWATLYSAVSLSLIEAWKASPWLFAGVVLGIVALAWGLTAWRRTVNARRSAEPVAHAGA